jgi:hypothetical protein
LSNTSAIVSRSDGASRAPPARPQTLHLPASPKRGEPTWLGWSDEKLLELRFCDLGVKIRGTRVERRLDVLCTELKRRGLRFRPHAWLSEEWFSPDGVPGIAIPFYLAHPRLIQLEQRQMFEVEGGTERSCLQILRHEAGHTVDTAFHLCRRKRWRELFGKASKPYPKFYHPKPYSKSFVLHLGWWYAQSHPSEDFAETFAVWLKPGSTWRRTYSGWPALKKLKYVDELMGSLTGQTAPVASRQQIGTLAENTRTLREHYEEKRETYRADYPEIYDRDLLRLFADSEGRGKRKSAAAFIQRHRGEIREWVARGTGEHSYTVDQIIDEVVVRCRELSLRFSHPDDRVKAEVAVLLSVQLINYLHSGHHRVPL